MNIPYRFSEASGAIEVPADKFTSCVCAWRNKVCPKAARSFRTARSGKVWYQPVQRTGEYQRALEGELSRTIETIGPVKGRAYIWQCRNRLYSSVNKNPFCIGDGKPVTRPRTR